MVRSLALRAKLACGAGAPKVAMWPWDRPMASLNMENAGKCWKMLENAGKSYITLGTLGKSSN